MGFTVYRPDSTLPQSDFTVLTFENVAYNHENCFDEASGKFVSQYPGLYLFTVTIVKDNAYYQTCCSLCFKKGFGEDCKLRVLANNGDVSNINFSSGTNTLVVHLDVGDEAYVSKCDPIIAIHQISSFSGVLIQSDPE